MCFTWPKILECLTRGGIWIQTLAWLRVTHNGTFGLESSIRWHVAVGTTRVAGKGSFAITEQRLMPFFLYTTPLRALLAHREAVPATAEHWSRSRLSTNFFCHVLGDDCGAASSHDRQQFFTGWLLTGVLQLAPAQLWRPPSRLWLLWPSQRYQASLLLGMSLSPIDLETDFAPF